MTEKQRRRPWLYAITMLGAGVLLVGFIFVGLSTQQTTQAIRETQQDNHSLLFRIESLSNRIDDCTKPEGKCHQRGARQTAGAVAMINQRATAAAACQVVLSRQPEVGTARELYVAINQCATDTLAVLARQHQAR